ATHPEDEWWPEIIESKQWPQVERVEGGSTRQDSVLAALRAAGSSGLVAVHDSVRPYFRIETLRRLLETVEEHGAAIPALPLRDTVHLVEGSEVRQTPDRSDYRAAQTPQCFRADILLEAMERAVSEGHTGTDEAGIVARIGHPVRIIEGDEGNIKITTPEDLLLVEPFLKRDIG
ncbi:MAG: 2-C-methyl-D-erythritol 4-phosphate cytidylyltransferase, partial [Thermoanaerobaculia bacterium]|nr:2-C-methyl-D-erythritol 4-phosphate cytidylyltransferase [Thermoanaerobaculia bacterium]